MYSIFVVAVNLHVSPKYDGFQQKMSVQESQFSSLDDFDDITIRVFDASKKAKLSLVQFVQLCNCRFYCSIPTFFARMRLLSLGRPIPHS